MVETGKVVAIAVASFAFGFNLCNVIRMLLERRYDKRNEADDKPSDSKPKV